MFLGIKFSDVPRSKTRISTATQRRYVQQFLDCDLNLKKFLNQALSEDRIWRQKRPSVVYAMLSRAVHGFFAPDTVGCSPNQKQIERLLTAKRQIAEAVRDELIRRKAAPSLIIESIEACLHWRSMISINYHSGVFTFKEMEHEIWKYVNEQIQILKRYGASADEIESIKSSTFGQLLTEAFDQDVAFEKIRQYYREVASSGFESSLNYRHFFCKACIKYGHIDEALSVLIDTKNELKKMPQKAHPRFKKSIAEDYERLRAIVVIEAVKKGITVPKILE